MAAKRKWQVSKSPPDYVYCTWPLDTIAFFLLPHNSLYSNCCILVCSNCYILVCNKTSLKYPLKRKLLNFFFLKNKFKGGGKEDLMCSFQNYKWIWTGSIELYTLSRPDEISNFMVICNNFLNWILKKLVQSRQKLEANELVYSGHILNILIDKLYDFFFNCKWL